MRKRELSMPLLNLKVVGNPLYSDVVDSSPRYAREAIMPSLSTVENFLRFQVQDKHNASYFKNVTEWRTPIQLQRYEKFLSF